MPVTNMLAPDAPRRNGSPVQGLPRMAFTALATLVGGVGYALLLGAVMLACGREPTPQLGLAFAVAGFASVALAPGLGLPPELPGSEAAPLAARQAWWVMTAAATGMGLYLIAIRRSLIAILGGLVLIVTPHVVGAPQAPSRASELPAALAAQFAARSLAIGFVFWVLIGLGLGWAWQALRGRRHGGRPVPETVLYVCTTCRRRATIRTAPAPGRASSRRCARGRRDAAPAGRARGVPVRLQAAVHRGGRLGRPLDLRVRRHGSGRLGRDHPGRARGLRRDAGRHRALARSGRPRSARA